MRFLLILVFLCFSTLVVAQSNFKDGFIITNNNDTIYGLIDFRTNKVNSEICRFKLSEDQKEEVYRPGEIEGFRFIEEGKYYVTRTIDIKKVPRTVFLEFLVEGETNLYYYLDGRTDYYFFETKDKEMIAARKKEPDHLQYTNLNEYTDIQYKHVLAYVFKDVWELSKKSQKAKFDRATMIEFTKEYHDKVCQNEQECIVFENNYKKQYFKFEFAPYIGIQHLDCALESRTNEIYLHSTAISPLLGVQVNLMIPQVSKSFGLLFDVAVAKTKIEAEQKLSYQDFYYERKTANLYTGLSLKYTYYKGKIRPSVHAGVIANTFLNPTSQYRIDVSSEIDEDWSYSRKNVLQATATFGYTFGCGAEYRFGKKGAVFFRLEYARLSVPLELNTGMDYLDFEGNNPFTLKQLKLGYIF